MLLSNSLIRKKRTMNKIRNTAILAFVTVSITLLYLWAQPHYKPPMTYVGGVGLTPGVILNNGSFTSSTDGNPDWTVQAKQIKVNRPQSGATDAVGSADIYQITNGVIYSSKQNGHLNSVSQKPSNITFQAGAGHYATGSFTNMPASLVQYHLVQWEFKLDNGVHLQTASKQMIEAPKLDFFQTINRRTGKPQQIIICNKGAVLTTPTLSVSANSLRFDPAGKVVETTDGVVATDLSSKIATTKLLSQSAYLTLASDSLYCPQSVSGSLENSPFSASSLILNEKKHQFIIQNLSLTMIQPEGTGQMNLLHTVALAATVLQSATSVQPAQHVSKPIVIHAKHAEGSSSTGIYYGFPFNCVDGDATITGDYATWNTHTHQMDAKGHLVYDSPEYHATCEKAHIDQLLHERIFDNSVVLTIKPTPPPPGVSTQQHPGANIREHGMVVTCDKVVYHTNTRIAELSGHLHFMQKFMSDGKQITRQGTADHAVYDQTAQTLTLYPPIHYQDSEGQTMETDQPFIIGTAKGDETISGNDLTATMPADTEDSSADTSSTTPAKVTEAPKKKVSHGH